MVRTLKQHVAESSCANDKKKKVMRARVPVWN